MDTAAAVLLLLHTVAALQVFAPNSHKAQLGKNVQVPCSFTVEKPPVDRTLLKIIWQFQGKQVLRVMGKSVKTTNPRLSSADGARDGGADLLISNTTVSDGGLYTCSVMYGSQRKEGQIRLDIQAPPQVTITGKTVVLNEESILHCSVTGFYPVDISIKWFRGREIMKDVSMEIPWRDQDGVYNVNSSVTIIPTEEDRGQNFSCRVQHESLQQPLQEIFQLLYGALPTVHILPHTFKKNIEQILVCLVSGFYPESIVVNWVLDGMPVQKSETKRINSSAVETILHFTPTEENWGTEVSCVVEHETLLRPQAKSVTVLGKDLKANYKPLVVTAAILLSALLGAGTIFFYVYRNKQKRHPKLRNITYSTDGSFSLNVDHFYPEAISVTWEVFQPPSTNNPQALQSTSLMQQNQDGTFNVTNTTESLRDKVIESEKYIVRAAVKHQKLKRPSYREWSNQNKDNTSFRSSPQLGELLAPRLMLSREAQLQCTISHFYPDCLTVNWIRKVMDKEEIIQTSEEYKISSHRSQQQHDKTFICTACLVLTPLMEDQGSEIICRVTHPTLEEPAERSTGHLQVWVQPTVGGPMQLSISDSGDVTATLLLLKFYPKDIRITWTYGGSEERRPSEETPTTDPDGTFSMNTRCTIPGHLFKEEDFKITVTWKHEAMDRAESREMSVGHPDYPWHPRIIDMTPLILQLDKITTVTCKISTFFPDNLMVSWYEKKGTSLIPCAGHIYNTSYRPERMADNSYSCSASLSFTALSQSDDLEFICRVFHPSLKQSIEQSTRKATMRVIPQMEVPVKFTISQSDAVKCFMRLLRFYPSDIKITWTNEDKVIPSTRRLIQTDGEQTFDATSECSVPWKYFISGVRVTWEHQSLPSPQHRDLHTEDLPWHPVIEEIVRPVFCVNIEARLQCKISQYYPNDLAVMWNMKKKEGNVVLMEDTSSTAQRQPDNTYSCTASLVLTPSVEEHDGAEIICRVQHPSYMGQHIERSTGPMQVHASPRMQDPSIRWSLGHGGEVLCSLILQSFYPKPIEIEWSCNPNCYFTSKETYEVNQDLTYNVRSECAVSQELISHPDFRITVTWRHSSMAEPERREMCIKDAGLPWYPTVSDIITPVLSPHEEVTLRCGIGGHFPRILTISWFVKERGRDGYVPVDRCETRYQRKLMTGQYSDTGYQSTALLHFRPSLGQHHGVWFMCRVQHASLELPIEKTAGPLFMSLTPEQREQAVVTCDGDEVLYSVTLRRFFPKVISVTWMNGDGSVLASKTVLQVNDEEDEAFDAVSECRIPRADLRFPVRVTWQHSSMAEPQCLQLHQTDPLPDLEIGDINVPELILGKMATLTCRLYNYISGVHTVEWFEDGSERGEQRAEYDPRRTIDEQSEDERTYRANLTLSPVTRADDGITYICRVKTSNTQKTIEKRTERLHVKGTAEERTTEEQRTEGGRRLWSVNESINEEKQKTSAELETDLLGDRDNQDCTPAPRNGKSKGSCPAKELSGEEGTEECPSPANEPCDEEETDHLEESSTREDEELKKERKENKETSQVINNPFNEQETDESKEPSTRENEEENNEKEEKNKETSQVIDNSLNEKQSKQEETSEEVRRENSGVLCPSGESLQKDHEETSLLSNEEKPRAELKECSPHEMEIKSSDGLCAANQVSEEDDETKPLNNAILN